MEYLYHQTGKALYSIDDQTPDVTSEEVVMMATLRSRAKWMTLPSVMKMRMYSLSSRCHQYCYQCQFSNRSWKYDRRIRLYSSAG